MAKKQKVEIYIAAHKKFTEPSNKMYIPLHVGAKGKNDLGYTKDSTGKNISTKNPNYCELTGLYWIWKNSKADVVGLVHYRRYFYKNIFKGKKNILSEEDILKYLDKYDAIIAPKGYTWGTTLKDEYKKDHIEDDMIKCEKIIKKKYKDYYPVYTELMNGNHYSPFNMVITRKEVFDDYCKWLFDIFDDLEKEIDVNDGRSNYDKRVFGFLSERLFNVWLLKNHCKTKEVFVMNNEENILKQKVQYVIKKIIKG